MRVRNFAALVALAAVGSTCVWYTSGDPRNTRPFLTTTGTMGHLFLRDNTDIRGELLDVDTAAYVLLTRPSRGSEGNRVVMVPRSQVIAVQFPFGSNQKPEPLSTAQLAELRLVARFPYGMRPAAATALLLETKQRAIDTIHTAPESSSQQDFLSAARAATARYRSADSAVAHGFKRVGVEFPFMGEHWVNLPRVLENRFDAAAPTVLIYITSGNADRRVLAGVGYSALLGAGEAPPASPAPASGWHQHNGAIIDESLPIHSPSSHGSHGARHAGAGAGAHDADSLRFVVLHAWVWTPNPAGAFVTENEALPLARLGSAGQRMDMDAEALRGLTLAQDSSGYYAQTVRNALRASDAEVRLLEETIAAHQDRARRAVRGTSADTTLLRESWISLWNRLENALPHRAAGLREIRARLN